MDFLRPFDRLNEQEFRAWLRSRGVKLDTTWSAPIRALYDLGFAFVGGDSSSADHAQVAAGIALRILLLIMFGSKEARVRKVFKRALARAGLATTFRPYDLRHTYAYLLLAKRAEPGYVAAQLGHRNAATLWRHYARWMPADGCSPTWGAGPRRNSLALLRPTADPAAAPGSSSVTGAGRPSARATHPHCPTAPHYTHAP